MKKIVTILMILTVFLSMTSCKKEEVKEITAEITMEKETYYDNQNMYFIVNAENITNDSSIWFIVAPEKEYETLEHVKYNQLSMRSIVTNNAAYEVSLKDLAIEAGRYMIVVVNDNTDEILASHSFKVIETKTEKEGWGDAHSEVYWEEQLDGHKIGSFSIVIKESTYTYHYDMDETQIIAQWINTDFNVDSWTLENGSIVSPDENYEIENPNVMLEDGMVFDVKLYSNETFSFGEIADKTKWPDAEFFTQIGLPEELAEIEEVSSILYEDKETLFPMDGADEMIITVESEELSFDFFKEAFNDLTIYATTQMTLDTKPYLLVIYETKGCIMHFRVTEQEVGKYYIKIVCNPYDV